MGGGETGGRKERVLGHKSKPLLLRGGWGDELMSSVCFNDEKNKPDKTDLFVLNS